MKETAPKTFVFVLMPFSDDFRDTLNLVLRPLVKMQVRIAKELKNKSSRRTYWIEFTIKSQKLTSLLPT
jgi:hypothetical protein